MDYKKALLGYEKCTILPELPSDCYSEIANQLIEYQSLIPLRLVCKKSYYGIFNLCKNEDIAKKEKNHIRIMKIYLKILTGIQDYDLECLKDGECMTYLRKNYWIFDFLSIKQIVTILLLIPDSIKLIPYYTYIKKYDKVFKVISYLSEQKKYPSYHKEHKYDPLYHNENRIDYYDIIDGKLISYIGYIDTDDMMFCWVHLGHPDLEEDKYIEYLDRYNAL